ncbi:PadR family transcriptional regulator, partial [Halorientalis brevis]
KPSLDYLDLAAGDDVRLYDHPDGFEVVPADDDPRIVTDGGWLRGTHPPHEWHQLNGIERDLLFAIRRLEASNDTLSGQNIARECETLRDSPLSNGSIYPALSGLIDQDLVTKHERENTTANRYELTDEGEQLLAIYVATFETLFEDTEANR